MPGARAYRVTCGRGTSAGSFLAVDVGKSKILVAPVIDGLITSSRLHCISVNGDPIGALARLIRLVRQCAAPGLAVGISMFGPLDTDPASDTFGQITNPSDPQWVGVNVPQMTSQAIGRPVTFDYDTRAALLSAQSLRGPSRADTLVSVGTGIGAAHSEHQRIAPIPQFGHIWVGREADDHFVGSCRFHSDCLQGLASGRAVTQRAHAHPRLLAEDHPAIDLSQFYVAKGLHAVEGILGSRRFYFCGGLALKAGYLRGVTRHMLQLQTGANGIGTPGSASSVESAPAGYLSCLHGAAIMAINGGQGSIEAGIMFRG